MKRRAQSSQATREPRRSLSRTRVLLGVLTTVMLGASGVVPVSAFAAVPDALEPDDNYSTASPIVVDGAVQQHTISPEGDEDWVSFQVETGHKYAIRTASGAVPDDPNTELYLYNSDGTTLLTSNHDDETEDRGYYSRIDYTADANKTVFVKVIGWYTGSYALGVTLVGDSYEPDDSYAVANPIMVGGLHSSTPSTLPATTTGSGSRSKPGGGTPSRRRPVRRPTIRTRSSTCTTRTGRPSSSRTMTTRAATRGSSSRPSRPRRSTRRSPAGTPAPTPSP